MQRLMLCCSAAPKTGLVTSDARGGLPSDKKLAREVRGVIRIQHGEGRIGCRAAFNGPNPCQSGHRLQPIGKRRYCGLYG
jgi:hypothetical protein